MAAAAEAATESRGAVPKLVGAELSTLGAPDLPVPDTGTLDAGGVRPAVEPSDGASEESSGVGLLHAEPASARAADTSRARSQLPFLALNHCGSARCAFIPADYEKATGDTSRRSRARTCEPPASA